jgi:hypothetical protein
MFEVKSALLAEQGDQLQPTPGVDDLAQGSVDRRPQGGGAENLSGLLQDVWINFDRCLGHATMILGAGVLGRGGPVQWARAPNQRSWAACWKPWPPSWSLKRYSIISLLPPYKL